VRFGNKLLKPIGRKNFGFTISGASIISATDIGGWCC